MNEGEASVAYYEAINRLEAVIESGHRGSKGEVLEEIEEDLC